MCLYTSWWLQTIRTLVAHTERTLLGVAQKILTKVNKCLVFRLHGMMPDVHFNKFRHLRLLYSVCCRHWWDWTLLPISSKIWWNVCWTAFIAVLDWCLRCKNVGSESHLTMKTWQRERKWPNWWTCSFLKYLVHGTVPLCIRIGKAGKDDVTPQEFKSALFAKI